MTRLEAIDAEIKQAEANYAAARQNLYKAEEVASKATAVIPTLTKKKSELGQTLENLRVERKRLIAEEDRKAQLAKVSQTKPVVGSVN